MKLKEIINIIEKIDVIQLYIEYKIFDFRKQFETKEIFKRERVSLSKVIYNIFLLPALFLHELSHFIMMLLMFVRPQRFIISSVLYNDFGGFIEPRNDINYNLSNIFISLSPLTIIVLSIILPFFNLWFLLFLLYLLLAYKAALPSKIDLISSFITIKFMSKTNNKINNFDYSELTELELACYNLDFKEFVNDLFENKIINKIIKLFVSIT